MDSGRRWVQSMIRRGLSPQTIKRRRNTYQRFELWLGSDPRKATEADITAWLDSLAVGPDTRGHYTGDLAAYYQWARRHGHRPDDPTELIERPRRRKRLPRPIAHADLAMALELAGPQTRVILALASLAGLRAMDIARLSWSDVDLGADVLWVRDSKGGSDRVVPICRDLRAELVRWGVRTRGPVVPRQDGGYYRPGTISAYICRFFRDAGIPAQLHACRHFFATELVSEGSDVTVVAELMGHASLQTTRGYARVAGRAKRAAVATLVLPVAS